ncbi:hypothetical protein [Edwardsiella tarda]|uniref:Morphogenetic protein n=1 Tax=Edwardsiella tarda TaxID=636 RepID=A0A2A7U7S5_EDWTA|nr:hypothetical protein [Edwardsiella tarda]PEH74311.1 hypothetical protein CRM76_00845 [Edwardsiella tarda]
MKERPIIFNDEMVRAILSGTKTMTRRPMKVQPESPSFGLSFIAESKRKSDEGKYFWSISDACGLKMRSNPFPCPFGSIGDRLWVREAFSCIGNEDGHPIDADDNLCERENAMRIYRASAIQKPNNYGLWTSPDGFDFEGGWTPSILMPRWASRITLEITDVRVERLQDITEGDAQAEGISPAVELLPEYPDTYLTPRGDFATARVAFQRLWESIYGDDSWDANPWVWVIAFKRVATGIAAGASKGE